MGSSLAVLLFAGCAAAPTKPNVKDTSVPIEPMPTFQSPARWDYHPLPPTEARAVLQDNGACVLTAEGGQRWKITPTKSDGKSSALRASCAGHAEGASTVANDELVAIAHPSASSWLFVGTTGNVYEAPDALAPFRATTPPPEPLSRVSGGGKTVLATTTTGAMLRWEEGGWKKLKSPPPAHVYEVAVASDGSAVAVGYPEQLFTSRDEGSTWSLLSAPRVGADRAGVTGKGTLLVQGLFESLEVHPGATPAFEKRAESLHPSPALELEPFLAVSATAVRTGRAALDGERYAEVSRPEDEGAAHGYRLILGKLDAPLVARPLEASDDCTAVRVALRGRFLAIACWKSGDFGPEIALRRSEDGGKTLTDAGLVEARAGVGEYGDPIALSSDGSLLLTGACKHEAKTDGGAPDASAAEPAGADHCEPVGPLLVKFEGGHPRIITSSAPQLGSLPREPVFSPDGRSAYFLGPRQKDSVIALFTSRDGGETFTPRSVVPDRDRVKPSAPPPPDEDGDPDEPRERSDEGDIESLTFDEDRSTLTVGEDGSVSFLLRDDRSGKVALVIADEDGKLIRASRIDQYDAFVGVFGRRALALGSLDNGARVVRETSDGGATWVEDTTPGSVLREWERGMTMQIACSASACLVGETLTRIGWTPGPEVADAEPPADAPPQPVNSVLTPIACEYVPKSTWKKVDDLNGVDSTNLPTISDVLRGRALWSILTTDFQTGKVGVVVAELPARGDGDARVTSRELLPAIQKGQEIAWNVTHQAEGYVAARAPVPKPNGPLKGFEVVWENFNEGTHARGKLPDLGAVERNDIENLGVWKRLSSSLLSVSPQGVFVTPHRAGSKNALSFFLHKDGKAEPIVWPTWPTLLSSTFHRLLVDGAHAGGKLVPVMLVGDGDTEPVTVTARRDGAGWTFDASATLPPVPAPPSNPSLGPDLVREREWTYRGDTIGITSIATSPSAGTGWATFQEFLPDGTLGPPTPLATPFDLPAQPKPCPAEVRATTPRLSAPAPARDVAAFPGTRHAVFLSEPPVKGVVATDRVWMLTGSSIVHGTPSSPCIGAWVATRTNLQMSAVISGNLTSSWAFRSISPAEDPSRGRRIPTTLEYRPMTCKWDPSSPIPEEAYQEPGTTRVVRR